MEWLKELLGNIEGADDLYSKITQNLWKNFVAKSDFNAKSAELKAANDKIKELSASADDADSYKQKYDELKKKYDTDKTAFEAQIASAKKDYALEAKIAKAGVRNIKAYKALLDMDKITMEGDEIKGYDEQEAELKKSDSYLFEKVVTKIGNNVAIGDTGSDDKSFGAQIAEESAKATQANTQSFLDVLGIKKN